VTLNPVQLQANQIVKSFDMPDRSRQVILNNLDLTVGAGMVTAVSGASGSGKSTLLHLLGALDRPDAGTVSYAGRDVHLLRGRELEEYRNRVVGFIFQFHYLMPELTVGENVAAPLLLRRFDRDTAFPAALDLLKRVGLADKAAHMPHLLSGGERQRAAIARALVTNPQLLLADEPTGSLDWKTGEAVFQLIRDMIRERGLTAVVVTHNPQIAAQADARYLLHGGRLEAV
jgi:lipoprotein-releasing system ATP-binding protein